MLFVEETRTNRIDRNKSVPYSIASVSSDKEFTRVEIKCVSKKAYGKVIERLDRYLSVAGVDGSEPAGYSYNENKDTQTIIVTSLEGNGMRALSFMQAKGFMSQVTLRTIQEQATDDYGSDADEGENETTWLLSNSHSGS